MSTASQRRVAVFAIAISKLMGLPREQVEQIAWAATFYDVGMTFPCDSQHYNHAPLTPSEEQIIREHCNYGYRLLKKTPFLEDAAETFYAHHEHYDGSGCPRGLKGDSIPLGGRIMAVATAFADLTSYTLYRPARSSSLAREEIRRCSRHQFDPEIVEAFCRVPDAVWRDLIKQCDSGSDSAP